MDEESIKQFAQALIAECKKTLAGQEAINDAMMKCALRPEQIPDVDDLQAQRDAARAECNALRDERDKALATIHDMLHGEII